MNKESVGSALLCIHGQGARLALMYAKMQGFDQDTISVDQFPRFIHLISSEPMFFDDTLATTVAFLRMETAAICRMDNFEQLVFHGREVDPTTRDHVLAFRAAVQKASVSEVFSYADFDAREWLKSITVSLRATDLDEISKRLEDRRDHLKPLLLRANARSKNMYGEIDPTEYLDEIDSFLWHAFPEGKLKFFYKYVPLSFVLGITDEWLDGGIYAAAIPFGGQAFVAWCAERIRTQGWAVELTVAAGEQGIDILARKPDLFVAIQCKRYDGAIGNEAVEEAIAGKIHYQADIACVIGTGGFTQRARDVSSSDGVILTTSKSIRDFSNIVLSG